ncbi:protease [Chryseobacterium sp. P1-3]|uniref:Protease n=1 Tax=Chryseobacterium gallinarum TaxID=1324352 RepID=A0A0G3M5V9_CHRGL|nr:MULTISPECIES: rhomboid family intramembrane serine protease [Chryseobacterium]AKK74506.1 protease [Chryseobacterium gallinarum]KFF74343.1 protease [Chryseobacterium sp. P1-3]MCL8538335.1 rhomboid family intramembrane serine protease [Chryseobacterium gallinarum]QIY89697.1 rhomboid family intramembrane serine protease [Chryseobacterium gallinarum]
MSIPVLIIIAVTCILSYRGFNDVALFEKYKFNVGAIENRKEYIRLISSAFLHADFMHLFFNMLSLYFFQAAVTMFFGNIGFLIIYFGSMILGNLFSLIIYKKQPWYSAIGASGAVSGIIFASIAMAPNEISVNFLPGWLFGTLYFGYSVYMMLNPKQWDNLGHAAHLGGAFFGLVYSIALHPQQAMGNILYLGAMSLPLIYLAYQIFVRKRIR